MPRADANVQRTSRSASVWGGAKTEGDVRSSAFTGSKTGSMQFTLPRLIKDKHQHFSILLRPTRRSARVFKKQESFYTAFNAQTLESATKAKYIGRLNRSQGLYLTRQGNTRCWHCCDTRDGSFTTVAGLVVKDIQLVRLGWKHKKRTPKTFKIAGFKTHDNWLRRCRLERGGLKRDHALQPHRPGWRRKHFLFNDLSATNINRSIQP